MAGLEDVVQHFVADVSRYVEPLREAIAESERFAEATHQDDGALNDLRDKLQEASDELVLMSAYGSDAEASQRKLGEVIGIVSDFLDSERDHAVEAGAALGDLRDKAAEAAEGEKMIRDASVEDDIALDGVRDRAEETASALSRLRDKAFEAAAGLAAMGTASDVASGFSGGAHGLPLMVLGIGALVIAIAAIAPALVAAGLGIGAFAAFAVPTFQKVFKAVQGGQTAIDALPPSLQKAAESVEKLKTSFEGIAQKFQPQALQILNDGLRIANELLPKLVPLAQAGAKALHGLLESVSKGIDSKGFTNFLHTMTQLIGPAVAAIGRLVGALGKLFGGILTKMAPVSVPFINFLTHLVKLLSGPVTEALKLGAELFVGLFKALSPLLKPLATFADKLIKDVGTSFQSLIGPLTKVTKLLGPELGKILNTIEPVLANLITPNSPLVAALRLLPGLLNSFFAILNKVLSFIQANPWITKLAVEVISLIAAFRIIVGIIGIVGAVLDALLSPVILIVAAIAALVVGIIYAYKHFQTFRNIVNDVGHFFESLWKGVLHAVGAVINWFVNGPLKFIQQEIRMFQKFWAQNGQEIEKLAREAWNIISNIIKVAWNIIMAILKVGLIDLETTFKVAWDIISGVVKTVWNVIADFIRGATQVILDIIGGFLQLIQGHWSNAWHDLQDAARSGMNMIKNIISDIAHGFINILYNAGKDIVQGLINGIKSMFGSVSGIIGSLGKLVSGSFGGILKMLSPSKVFYEHGKNIVLGLINGIQDNASLARATSGRLANSVLAGSYEGTAGSLRGRGGGGGGVVVNLTVNGSVVTEQQLEQQIQMLILRYTKRNSGNGLYLPNRGS